MIDFVIGFLFGVILVLFGTCETLYDMGAEAVTRGEYECRLIEQPNREMEWECKRADQWGGAENE